MDILIVSPYFAPYIGVGALRMTSFAKYLTEKKHNLTILRNSPEMWDKKIRINKVDLNADIIDVFYEGEEKNGIKAYKKALDEILAKKKYDAVLFSCGPFYGMTLGPYIKKRYNQNYIIEQRDLWMFNNNNYDYSLLLKIRMFLSGLSHIPTEYRAIKNSMGMVVVCPMDKTVLQNRYQRQKKKVHCILNGYDEFIPETDTPDSPEEKYITCFGKFAYYGIENVRIIFKAISNMIKKGYKIKFCHIGENERELDEIADELALPDGTVIQMGYVTYREGMKILYKSAIGVVQDAIINAYGTKIFDYMCADIPVIACVESHSGIAQLLEHAENAFICHTSGNVESAVEIILRDNITSLGMKNREQYSRKVNNEKYEKLILKLINK